MTANTRNVEWFRALVDSLGYAVILCDTEGRVELLNKAAEQITGSSEANAIGQPLANVVQLRTRDGRPIQTDLTRLATLNGSSMSLGSDLVVYRVDGDVEVEGEAAPFAHAGRMLGVIITLRDVTRQRVDEAGKHRSQTLRTISHLAGSIAHDLNNVLTVILGYSEELLTCIPGEHPARAVAEHIRDAGDLASKVAAQLQILGRKDTLLPAVLDLTTVIDQTFDHLRSLAGPGILVIREATAPQGEIQADPEQIRTLLANLVIYGNHVLPATGQIAFHTTVEEFAPAERGARARKLLRLRVIYTGSGVRDEGLDNFKAAWRGGEALTGQGLELFIIGGIVSDSSAQITAGQVPGTSLTFDLLFPCVEDPHPILSRDYEVPALAKPTILLVEDDDDIRSLLSRFFARRGYHLLEAANGEDAIMTSDLYEGPIDVVITDVAMPRMSGPQLVKLLAKNRPETKALLISGYPPEPSEVKDLIRQGVHFLQKPFRSEELLARVQQVLIERKTNVN